MVTRFQIVMDDHEILYIIIIQYFYWKVKSPIGSPGFFLFNFDSREYKVFIIFIVDIAAHVIIELNVFVFWLILILFFLSARIRL